MFGHSEKERKIKNRNYHTLMITPVIFIVLLIIYLFIYFFIYLFIYLVSQLVIQLVSQLVIYLFLCLSIYYTTKFLIKPFCNVPQNLLLQTLCLFSEFDQLDLKKKKNNYIYRHRIRFAHNGGKVKFHTIKGCVSLGKSKCGFLYPKTDFAFLYLNPKMD